MEYHRIAMGGRLYALRMAKGMTQEQLAQVLCVSPAAVSKWERNLATPGVELLWMLADFFDCTMDELVGRREKQLGKMGIYGEGQLRLAAIAGDLLRCSEVSRQKGLLALEEEIADFQGGSEFLPFAIRFFLQAFRRQMEPDRVWELLCNYAKTLPEEQNEGSMVVEALSAISSGEHPELIKEITASYIGIHYREKIMSDTSVERSREEILERYRDKKPYSEATNLLEDFNRLGDFAIQTILRNLDNDTFTAAMCGASGKVAVCFLSNLSQRMLVFTSEDMDNWQGTEEEILTAQRKVVEIRDRCGYGENIT